jgi:phage terminase large subunit GpA-like protein
LNKARLFTAFCVGICPAPKLDIVEWAAANVRLARSSRSETADLRQTPWLIQPLETILGHEASEIVINAPVGSGKSTLFEIIGTYIVAAKPGPTLFSAQTDTDAAEWMATGLLPALKGCALIDPLWPKDRHAVRKDMIQFPHMPVWVGGANLSNFQSKSCDTVLIDEAWLLKKSLLEEARRRCHDRFQSKVVLVSQSGTVGDDFDLAYRQCFVHRFSYLCWGCKEFHPYVFENLKWTSDRTADGGVIWESLAVHYECPCGHAYRDTVNDRRAMAESGSYVAADSENPLSGHIAFHYNALCIWWVSWQKLVIQFLKANEARKKGDFDPLRQFFQKRLAISWDEMLTVKDAVVNLSDYTLAEAKPWEVTILAADVQLDYLYYVVRTFAKSGESRLLEYGKVINFSDLKAIQEKWGIKSKAVFIDSAYRTQEVKEHLARYGWLGLNGRSDQNFLITNKRTGKKYRRIFGAPVVHSSAIGNAVITYYSSNSAKDILFILKSGNGARWEVPSDISEDYKNQLNSEIKTLVDGKPFYKQVKTKNHILDCETEALIGAMMHGCYPVVSPSE